MSPSHSQQDGENPAGKPQGALDLSSCDEQPQHWSPPSAIDRMLALRSALRSSGPALARSGADEAAASPPCAWLSVSSHSAGSSGALAEEAPAHCTSKSRAVLAPSAADSSPSSEG